jgi:hypothetical protein
MSRDERLLRQRLDAMNQSPLERGRNMKLGLLQRHPEALLSLRAKSSELKQQKQVL